MAAGDVPEPILKGPVPDPPEAIRLGQSCQGGRRREEADQDECQRNPNPPRQHRSSQCLRFSMKGQGSLAPGSVIYSALVYYADHDHLGGVELLGYTPEGFEENREEMTIVRVAIK